MTLGKKSSCVYKSIIQVTYLANCLTDSLVVQTYNYKVNESNTAMFLKYFRVFFICNIL